ncbi:hypothetical protein [Amycolatopsis taiwanensis]|uniref:Uncharacterized protein n=1 Tax=Amycolatopsis taiwanensis TaxID=342230 RepID=A0A9W6QWP2_9PSEU|nr:hypothetical protein [Amycolatopsis taiwanensis]GLY64051.1 hypothetical protein Atai01_06700 [Amycolatopsis taiwanensis]
MFEIIITWIGAVLGIAVLLAMAFGAFVLDFNDVLNERRGRHHDVIPDQPVSH